NMDLILNNYESVTYVTELKEDYSVGNYTIDFELEDDVYYSTKWGIALRDDMDLLGKNIIFIDYVHEDSPLLHMVNKGIGQSEIELKDKYAVVRIAFTNQPSALSIQGAENMISMLDMVESIREFEFQTPGGGIRGSIITTLVLIGLTLVFALPIGI